LVFLSSCTERDEIKIYFSRNDPSLKKIGLCFLDIKEVSSMISFLDEKQHQLPFFGDLKTTVALVASHQKRPSSELAFIIHQSQVDL
jgi:hypothetical protein